ncbi:MAG: hypothetical protein ABJA66_07435 [Actinomycetota bacterium]
MANGKINRRQRVTKTPLTGEQKNTLKREPLIVALQLRFIDCEGIIRPFPKDFEAEIIYGNNQKTEIRKIDNDEGKLIFPLLRDDAKKYKFLRLQFVSKDKNHIICEKRGEAGKTATLGNRPIADEKAKQGQRFFKLPPRWSLLTSEWAVATNEKIFDKTAKEKKFLLLEDNKERSIGTREEPVKMLLNPNWQYLRFEFFDRYYGHSTDHGNKPISIPAITVEGFYKAKSDTTTQDVRSNWVILQDDDEKKIIQCLPWILQAKTDGTAEPKPDKDSSLHFKQPEDTYVISESATVRKLKSFTRPFSPTDADSLKPGANRLKHYDLPELWKSQKYWCRLSDNKTEQGFFEKMADKKTMRQKPLIFSLDDIVLTDDKIAPLSIRDTDKVVVFYHEFLDAVADANKRGDGGRTGATYLKNGLYKPGPDLVEAITKASDDAKAAEKAKLEKEARETAVAARKKLEEDNARAAAEGIATTALKTPTEITEAGDKAVADVATDVAAQQRITDAGNTTVANVSTDPTAQTKINTAGRNAATLADAPLQAKLKGAAKQKTAEEKTAGETAVAARKKLEEDNARAAAEGIATTAGKNPAEITKAGDKAVADVAKDAAAQLRIKNAGDAAVLNVATDVPTQTRITNAGKAAEDDAIAFPFSDVLRHEEVPNYISDYPHWSRLVICNGNLFDVFDKRTTTGDVIGARAAVRWVDATPSGIGVAAGAALSPRPDFTPVTAQQDEAFYIVQPYFQQKFFVRSKHGTAQANRSQGVYDEWGSPIANDDAKVAKNARTDMALLRTSNYKDTNEETVVFRYHRLSFDFTSEESLLNPTGPPPAGIQAKRIKWVSTFVKTSADRWNGNDDINNSRAWIVEDKATNPKLRTQVVSFFQRLDKTNAHFHIKTVKDTKPDGSRQPSSMEASLGDGNFQVSAGSRKDATGNFPGAHEMGHAGGQPDDYAPSIKGQTGFGSNHTPGTPFILDINAMMKSNRQVRARSYWHITEWLRQLNPFTNTKFQIEHGGYIYKVPHYNHADRPGRNYTHWAVKAKIFHDVVDPICFDSYLYFLGQDEYSRVVLPSQPDGIMVVSIKLLFNFQGYTNDDKIIEHIFTRINQKINTALNKKRVHARFSLPGINRGGANTFEKCMLHFSPRFEVTAGMPAHLKLKIKTPADPPAATTLPVAGGGGNYLIEDDTVPSEGPFSLAEMYSFIQNGQILPDTQVDDGSGMDEANNFPDLQTLFDVYYWYEDGGVVEGPKTLLELYNLAKAETIKWNTPVVGPGWGGDGVNADEIADILPALKRWFYEDSGGSEVGPFTEIQMHDNFNTVPIIIDDDTSVTGGHTDNVWCPAEDCEELEAEFKGDVKPRTLDFRFPIYPGTLGGLDPVVKHLENVVFKSVCQMLGLSVKDTDVNYYGNADAYKDIVKACVNDNALNPTMSRPVT